ncbi:MAG TPA: outer membrane lipoprotein carrier protein LolA [Telmatospirillum sp.]|nr:outer membrane lipoprotein carrier protein LolA [Telmatospirillum sp.]
MSSFSNPQNRAIPPSARGWFARTLVAALFSLTVAGGAVSAAAPAATDQAEIDRAEEYLNGVTTLKAHFMQVSPDGSTTDGTVYLSRPGRLRLDYEPPSPIQVIADGNFLIYYDKQLKQVSYLGLESSPAGVLVRAKVKLSGADLKVTKVAHQPGVLQVTVIRADDPGQGSITLVFTQSPFQLRQWQVTDPQGQITTVSLFDTELGVTLDKEMFYFKDPTTDQGPDLSTNRQ